MIHDKIQERGIELEDSNSAREREVLTNEIDTLKCVLNHLFKLKPPNDEIKTVEIGGAIKNNFHRTNHKAKQLFKMQDSQTSISPQILN